MQAVDHPLVALINGTKQFRVPAFQRDYSWTTEQCAQLWKDIVRAGTKNDDHFLGSIVYIADNSAAVFSSWLVVDGQQRLTTLTLLLIALRDHLREIGWSGSEPTAEQIDAYFLTNEHETGERRHKVVLRRHDDDTLRALLDRRDPAEVENNSEAVVQAYRHFRTQLNTPEADPEVVYKGIGRLQVVDVTLHRTIDDPQRVFESLNSTGVDLTQSDLIRNYLLMGLPEPDQTRLYNDYWSRVESLFRRAGSPLDAFLRDYIALRQETTSQARADRIHAEFRSFWQPSDPGTLETLLADLVRFARYFVHYLQPEGIESKPLARAMRAVRSLGSAHAILVMRLYQRYEESSLTHDDFVRALVLISSYLVRRSVLGLQTRNYWAMFARMAHSVTTEAPFASLQVAIARQSYKFPADHEFVSALQTSDLYKLRICWHILAQLENAGQAEPSPVREYSIEHIMPQSIEEVVEWQEMLGSDWKEDHRKWLHRLGNLTLTAYNSRFSNRPFEDKKTIEGGLDQSAVRLNEFVRRQATWTAAEIEERGEMLAQRALKVWPHHDADERLIVAEEVRELRRRESSSVLNTDELHKSVPEILGAIREAVHEIGESIDIVEGRSLCFYNATTADFFAEALPMQGYVRLLIPIEFDEVDDPEEVARDATAFKFLPNVTHRDCGVFVDIASKQTLLKAVAMVRQVFHTVQE